MVLLPRGSQRLGPVLAAPGAFPLLFSHPRVALSPLRAGVLPPTFSELQPWPQELLLQGVLYGDLALQTQSCDPPT